MHQPAQYADIFYSFSCTANTTAVRSMGLICLYTVSDCTSNGHVLENLVKHGF